MYAVLYGSRALGNFKPGSDIDLTLHGDDLTARMLGDIAEALDDLLLTSMYVHSKARRIVSKTEHEWRLFSRTSRGNRRLYSIGSVRFFEFTCSR
jgi:phosphatidylserine/phosphatidylglycerophosphate/cardiolipin synthase-like enzyme